MLADVGRIRIVLGRRRKRVRNGGIHNFSVTRLGHDNQGRRWPGLKPGKSRMYGLAFALQGGDEITGLAIALFLVQFLKAATLDLQCAHVFVNDGGTVLEIAKLAFALCIRDCLRKTAAGFRQAFAKL
ncbi:MAG: hypothetical protein KF696_09240 [Planctomycetes bacterium]|nr:hypothetical protein [Planctomycetota bacterium]MCW8136770.1 hypothetical protein [Planctomycetota bacterium]